MRNIMIDIESLGTRNTSVILSIGAIEFDETQIGDSFYTRIDIDSCLEHGLTIDGSTLEWWMSQADDAKRVFDEPGKLLVPALLDLQSAFSWKDKLVWANGTSFDISILEHAYTKCKLKTPWMFYNVRDYRTVKGMFPQDLVNRVRVEPVVAHHALEDARAQMLTLQALLSTRTVIDLEAA